jgi:hypothetical protein
MQSVRDQPSDRGFSSTHKANQSKVSDLAGAVHQIGLAEFAWNGTTFLWEKVRIISGFSPYSAWQWR